MAMKFNGCHFEGNGIAIKVPESANMEFSETKFIDNETVFEIFSSPNILAQLNLPENTPEEYLHEIVEIYRSTLGKGREEQQSAVESSSLFQWLGRGASVASISSAIVNFLQNL